MRERSAPDADRPRNIVLFSDGTGNSSAKLFKTNVWRMYEAVDLGPPQNDGDSKQIAFYDNGVGTSGLKPVAALGAIFGIGLKRNVLDLYRYACRNYRPGPDHDPVEGGDRIYGFGFSRGAFTIRVAIDLIGSQGLVTSASEAELIRKSEEAWRVYRRRYEPRRFVGLTRLARAAGKAWRERKDDGWGGYDPAQNYKPIIQFLGVWDTVAAYGGPITEITRAIDNWIVRLSMADYQLGPDVRCARHALSIDDERDAFRPVLWDEIAEDKLRSDPATTNGRPWLTPSAQAPQRIEQVWFTGMHADVGGGYPDESLSFVSFLWMLEEAKKAGLRPVPHIVDRFRALASSDGPIHDSRAGLGSYYRYQPRKIGAWLEPIDRSTLIQRDPDQKRGMLEVVKVHESVAARIANGTDRYAPITLPEEIRIVPPQAEGENAPLSSESEPVETLGANPSKPTAAVAGKPRPLISQALRDRLQHPTLSAQRVAAMEPVWRQVTTRRWLYFVSLGLTLLLFGMPLWIERLQAVAPTPAVFSSGHGLLATVTAALAGILPAFLTGLIETWAAHPFHFLLLLGGILLARAKGSRVERDLRDRTRKVWDIACDIAAPLPDEAPPKRATVPVRATRGQRVRIWLKWSFLPLVIGVLFLLLGVWLLAVLTTRAGLAVAERTQTFCQRSAGPLPELAVASRGFSPRSDCVPMGATVTRGETYIVDVDVTELWKDSSHRTTPAGLRASDMGFIGVLAAPFRRAPGAAYLQPMVHIRHPGEWWAGPAIVPLRLIQQGSPRTRWRGSFVAPRSGELSLFANDVPAAYFYDNNSGGAVVTIVHADQVVRGGGRSAEAPRRRQSASAPGG